MFAGLKLETRAIGIGQPVTAVVLAVAQLNRAGRDRRVVVVAVVGQVGGALDEGAANDLRRAGIAVAVVAPKLIRFHRSGSNVTGVLTRVTFGNPEPSTC